MIDFDALFKDYYFASKEEADKRMNICSNCPELTKRSRCKKCGCFMKIKTKLKRVSCPIQKW